jgi:hypothetical protein
MSPHIATGLALQLSERDHDILLSLERFRLLTTTHIQRLHFAAHASRLAAVRAAARAMQRLQGLGVVAALSRRIGGVRKGSASYVWQLAAAGERYLRATRGQARRRRFLEPGLTFVNHTLAVNDVAVGLLEADREVDGFTVERLGVEPANWRSYLGSAGQTQWLKPDLHVVMTNTDDEGEYEEHAFLEIDLGTEHLPRIQAKSRMYAAYYSTGAYQAKHGVFPEVIWLSTDRARRAALRAAVGATPGLPASLFRLTSPDRYLAERRSNQHLTEPGGQEGGTPS